MTVIRVENPVTHPAHYTQGGIECIDAIRAALTDEEFAGFCKGNNIKYTWRANHKGNCFQDLQKAVWYINRLIHDKLRLAAGVDND